MGHASAENTDTSTPTVVGSALEHFIVCVHCEHSSPDEQEWGALVDLASEVANAHGRVFILVDTPGPGPNVMQRAALNVVAGRHPFRAGVISDSVVARTIIKAFGWMGAVEIRGFEPDDADAAYAYLGASAEQAARLHALRTSLKARVGR